MLIDIPPTALDLLIDLATDEIKSIVSGVTTYGAPDDNLSAVEDLDEFVTIAKTARGW